MLEIRLFYSHPQIGDILSGEILAGEILSLGRFWRGDSVRGDFGWGDFVLAPSTVRAIHYKLVTPESFQAGRHPAGHQHSTPSIIHGPHYN